MKHKNPDGITRRDYLNSTLLASGTMLLGGACPLDLLAQNPADWNGYSGIGDYAGSNGNTLAVITEGHKIRDQVYGHSPEKAAKPAGEFDCIVIGGGISGLAAALAFQRQSGPGKTCLVLEDHAIFGGLARRNEFLIEGQRIIANQASAMFFPPLPGTFLADFYASIGIDENGFEYQKWTGRDAELPLGRTFYFDGGKNSAFYFGAKFGQPSGMLLPDPWGTELAGAPIPEQSRHELLSVHGNAKAYAAAQPKQHGDPVSRRLDSITLEQHLMETYGISRETVRTFLSPVTGGGNGIGADVLSAYADYAADVLFPWQYGKGAQMFPGGNTGVARHIVKALIPDSIPGAATMTNVCRTPIHFQALDRRGQPSRIRLGCTVFSVKHQGMAGKTNGVRVLYGKGGKLYSVRGRGTIMAGGSWTTKHIVQDLPQSHRDAYAQFYRSPCLVANVAIRNWRFLYKLGIFECQWFEGIGNYTAIRRLATFGQVSPAISPDSPVVLTLKILFSYPGLSLDDQVTRGRAELLATSFREYERRIGEQLSNMFSAAGFDANRDIAGIILNRWGHAYLSAQPGFFFGTEGMPAPGEVLRNNPFDRIAFANSDITGIMDHRASIMEGYRAVEQIRNRLAG